MTESEKPKHCECEQNRDKETHMYMWEGNLNIFDPEYAGYGSYKVNFCPMCGMKVQKDTEIKELREGTHYGADGKEWIVSRDS